MAVEMSSDLQFTGWFGELKTVIAKKLFLRSSDYVDINNVTIRTRRGTTQIDHVIISRYGVFVVETKNMSGWVFGSENDPFWIRQTGGTSSSSGIPCIKMKVKSGRFQTLPESRSKRCIPAWFFRGIV